MNVFFFKIIEKESFFSKKSLIKALKLFILVWNPNTFLRIIWDITSMIFIFIQMLLVPIVISFEIETGEGLNVANSIYNYFLRFLIK